MLLSSLVTAVLTGASRLRISPCSALNLGSRWSSAIPKPESIWQWLFCTRVT
ncbi:hypothetical protein BJX66DRAFT_318040 [Aspergillus keveii]|uniref:Uncharacterized protein n=1 Tax=Aspergillus keveii TaxID=714993 RepID=A0ABR4FKD5_9EURO